MIENRQRRVRVAAGPLEEFFERARRELQFPRDGVAVRFVSDEAMARLNREFRGKQGPTDVLSFPAEEESRAGTGSGRRRGEKGEERFFVATAPQNDNVKSWKRIGREWGGYIGDIAIAPGVARRNARQLGRSLDAELRVLILHGMIHLAGYDHETDNGEMERLEKKLRRRLGIA